METHPIGRLPHIVVVVDSDPAVRSSLKFSLEAEGWRVHTCTLAQDLLDRVNEEPLGCLIAEYRLEDMSGIDLVDRLRALNFQTPVIMLATHPTRGLRHHAERRNIPIVEKPLTGNTLTDMLRKLTP